MRNIVLFQFNKIKFAIFLSLFPLIFILTKGKFYQTELFNKTVWLIRNAENMLNFRRRNYHDCSKIYNE